MNIYKRQMQSLGLSIEEYSKILKVPEKITEKLINGNGEVVKDMEINNFLRRNLFDRHQEVEKNKEEKKVEAIEIKLERGKNSRENKKQYLLEKYADSKEVQWYINDYDKKIYYALYHVKNKSDLMRRYTFSCNLGRLEKNGKVGGSTVDRLVNKEYESLGLRTAYALICQLYDCFKLGNIKESKKEVIANKIINKEVFSEEDMKLKDWFYKFDFKSFCNRYDLTTTQFAIDMCISDSTVKAIRNQTYNPSMLLVKRLKDYVDSFENKFATQTVTGNAKVFDVPVDEDIMKLNNEIKDSVVITAPNEESTITPLYNDNEEILRSLLINRLTEEEKMLIKLFGGKL